METKKYFLITTISWFISAMWFQYLNENIIAVISITGAAILFGIVAILDEISKLK